MTRPLMRRKEAAQYLAVSLNWLRNSDCPKVLLPGQGPKGQSVVRYDPDDMDAWRETWSTKVKERRAS